MKFEFEHLGVIEKAQLDLADLTIICGDNNSGKTYITYAIYGFLLSWRKLFRDALFINRLDVMDNQNLADLNLEEVFKGKVNNYLSLMAEHYKSILPVVFASNEHFFENTKIRVTVDEQDFIAKSYNRNITDGINGDLISTLTKKENSPYLKLLIAENSSNHNSQSQKKISLWQFVSSAVAEIIFAPYFPSVHISSAERTGATIFRKELDFSRTRMLEALRTLDSDELKDPSELLKRMNDGYAWPVRDNVDFVRDLENLNKNTSELVEAHPHILASFDNIIGGSYKVTKDQELIYQPQKGKTRRYSMHESSSSIRALLDIGFYIRCKAKKGDIFIIDEPELNLHPKNQRAFARLLVQLVNAGVKIFITTHSDYIIKEFNTLIMLAQRTEHTETVRQEFAYQEYELLNPKSVHLYIAGEYKDEDKPSSRRLISTLKLAHIDPAYGIEVESFDNTIEEMNRIQNQIVFGGE